MRARSVQRPIVVAAVMVLPVSAWTFGVGTAVAHSESSCQVMNVTAGTASVAELQPALDAASPSDVLGISGVCAGTSSVTRSVALVGVPTYEDPVPKLDGESAGTVLTLLGQKDAQIQVTITGLTIQHGRSVMNGGGINSRRTDLLLDGSTQVIGNEAQYNGGGIAFTLGTFSLAGDTAVLDNQGYGVGAWAGGIYLRRGAMTLTDRALVAGNSAAVGGGIATYKGRVLVDADAVVEQNHASSSGGGIFTYDAAVRVRGDADVRGNDAQGYGGGVYLGGYRKGYLQLTVDENATVADNTSTLYGGGIAVSKNGVVSLKGNASVVRNHAKIGGGVQSAGRLRLLGRASVTSNTATASGGGLANDGVVVLKLDWVGTLCGNDPDDWPGCTV